MILNSSLRLSLSFLNWKIGLWQMQKDCEKSTVLMLFGNVHTSNVNVETLPATLI